MDIIERIDKITVDEMTVKIGTLRAKPIKKKYKGKKVARGMDMRNLGDYYVQTDDGGWEEISADLVETSMKDVPSEFMNDPLYKKVLTSKNEREYKKALDTLKSIRGPQAVKVLQNAIKRKQNTKFGGDTGVDADYNPRQKRAPGETM
jgi:hypothetical protein